LPGSAVHALGLRLRAPPDVPPADNHAHLNAHPVEIRDLPRHEVHGVGIDPMAALAFERLAAELQKDSAVHRTFAGHGHYSPRENRVNLRTFTFSPILLIVSFRMSCTVMVWSLINGCCKRETSCGLASTSSGISVEST